ncbi:MAG: hypothetical protein ACIWVG_26860 [Gloeotrichia echinulata HAB0833]
MASKKVESKYVVKTTGSKELKTVSARVPSDLYEKFNNAVKLAAENGMELSITKVVQVAMREAIKEVRSEIGEGKLQGALDL